MLARFCVGLGTDMARKPAPVPLHERLAAWLAPAAHYAPTCGLPMQWAAYPGEYAIEPPTDEPTRWADTAPPV